MRRKSKTEQKPLPLTWQSLLKSFLKRSEQRAYTNQIIRSSSSVGANYRASRRAKSNADIINKLKIVEEELDESLFFLELLVAFIELFRDEIATLYKEGETLLKIIVASIISSGK